MTFIAVLLAIPGALLSMLYNEDTERIPPEQRRQSLAQTWNRDELKGMLINSTVGWRPDPFERKDGRMHVKRDGYPHEYVKRIDGRKINHLQD